MSLKIPRVAILTENGFEQSELVSPKAALEKAGVTVHIVSPQTAVRGWDKTNWGVTLPVDKGLDNASPDEYDALILPGGIMNPDKLRQNDKAIAFIARFLESGKTVAAICHAPQTLIETGLLKGRRLTSYPSIRTDLLNAGADWVDAEVVVDKGLITSRSPKDLVAFNDKILAELEQGAPVE